MALSPLDLFLLPLHIIIKMICVRVVAILAAKRIFIGAGGGNPALVYQ